MTADPAICDPAKALQVQLARAAMVLVETLDIDPGQAVAWLRAYALVTGRTLADVATDVAVTKLRPHGR
jgi:hypothetical protein